jgi:hypothetical protein
MPKFLVLGRVKDQGADQEPADPTQMFEDAKRLHGRQRGGGRADAIYAVDRPAQGPPRIGQITAVVIANENSERDVQQSVRDHPLARTLDWEILPLKDADERMDEIVRGLRRGQRERPTR